MKKGLKLNILLVVSALFIVSIFTVPASAITNGTPDGDGHPYVCMVVFYDSSDNPLWRTTGSLVSPRVVLTAGHGTFGTAKARVWFETDIRGTGYPYDGPTAIEGKVYTHPDYWDVPQGNGLPGFDYHDVGVVVLSKRVTNIAPAKLPKAGFVDTLSAMPTVDLVGYGVQWQDHGDGVNPYDAWKWTGLRFCAPAQYLASKDVLHTEFLKLTANPGQDKGGTAFGDSGGPILLAGTNTILGINSFVTNVNCAGVTYAQRIDIPDILRWISGFR